MSNLYENINDLVRARGMTINQLCKKSGVAPSTMSELKSGHTTDLSRKNAEKVAAALGVTVGTLYGEPSEVEEIQDELFEKRKLLFDLSSKATKEELDKFIKMLNVMLGEES